MKIRQVKGIGALEELSRKRLETSTFPSLEHARQEIQQLFPNHRVFKENGVNFCRGEGPLISGGGFSGGDARAASCAYASVTCEEVSPTPWMAAAICRNPGRFVFVMLSILDKI